MIECALAVIAYGALITAVVLFIKGAQLEGKCNRDCNQGRKCDCEGQNE